MVAATVSDPPLVTLKLNGKAFHCRKCGEPNFVKQITKPIEALQYACVHCFDIAVFMGNDHVDELLPPRNDWQTPGGSVMEPEPGGLFTTLHEEYGFNVDVAASAENTKCPYFFNGLTTHTDALQNDWWMVEPSWGLVPKDARVWNNPPYKPKGEIEKWLMKALEQASEGVFSVHLIPMATSVGWFNDLVVPFAEWHSFRGRIPFIDPLGTEDSERTSPKQDNLLVIYDPNSNVVGHTAVRDAKTGRRLWTRPDVLHLVDAHFRPKETT